MPGLLMAVVFVISLAAPSSNALAAEGFRGVIAFRDGRTVEFEYLGVLNHPQEARLYGNLGKQPIKLEFHEFSEVHFSNPDGTYTGHMGGEAVLVSKDGRRFTLQDVLVAVGDGRGAIRYVYQDEITRGVKQGGVQIYRTVSHILIGKSSGDLKKNIATGEFFPSIYNYDPFTGAKLEWDKR
jgi:hypothetical protein